MATRDSTDSKKQDPKSAKTITKNHAAEEIRIVHSGEEYFEILHDMIAGARRDIHFQTYIFDNDTTGAYVSRALLDAAKRGVQIWVVLDAFGSGHLSKETIQKWQAAGIKFRFFGEFLKFRKITWGRRLHHKVIVTDGQASLIGGMNVADKYRGTKKEEPWLDFAVYFEGPASLHVRQVCNEIWEKKIRLRRERHRALAAKPAPLELRVLQHDYFRRKGEILRAYLNAIRASKTSLTIFASYFIPGRRLRYALRKAAARGVAVRVVVPGISDVPFVKYATEYFYAYCEQHKIRVFEWNRNILHAKIAVADDNWMTIGSFNLNHLSAYASIEMNVDTREPSVIKPFSKELEELIYESCVSVAWQRKGPWKKLVRWLAFHVVRITFRLVYLALVAHKKLFQGMR